MVTYEAVISRGAAAIGRAIRGGDAAAVLTAVLIAAAMRGGTADDGAQVNLLVVEEVFGEMLDDFGRQLASQIEALPPDEALRAEQAIANCIAATREGLAATVASMLI